MSFFKHYNFVNKPCFDGSFQLLVWLLIFNASLFPLFFDFFVYIYLQTSLNFFCAFAKVRLLETLSSLVAYRHTLNITCPKQIPSWTCSNFKGSCLIMDCNVVAIDHRLLSSSSQNQSQSEFIQNFQQCLELQSHGTTSCFMHFK
jgi:hypothetical protein